jgi:glycosyltransferase involved in cell wall biosynthesis
MTDPGRVLIIGAGPTGLGAAYRLHELGVGDFVVLEAEATPGGLAASYVDTSGFTWDMGGHVQFSHYSYYDRVLDKALGDGWLWHERESWIRIRNRFVPYPFQNNIHRLDAADRDRALDGLEQARSRREGTGRPGNFAAWIDQTFGDGIAGMFMHPYNLKVWGYPLDELDAGWIDDRVALPDLDRIKDNIAQGRDDVSWGPNRRFRFPSEGGTGAIWSGVARLLPAERLSFGQRAVVEMERRCVSSTPYIIANSEMIRQDLEETYPQMTARVEVIYNGYDPARFSLLGREENRAQLRQQLGLSIGAPVLLFAASGWRRKGLLELLQALQELPQVRLLVVGRDKVAEWRQLAAKLKVDSQVIFLEPRRDIQRLYHAVDATILPSWYDSFGFVTLESLACGTPAVVSRFAGSHELIRPGLNGMEVSRPDAIEEMRSAIIDVLRLETGVVIAASVAANTLANNVQKTLAVIARAVGSSWEKRQ